MGVLLSMYNNNATYFFIWNYNCNGFKSQQACKTSLLYG